MIFFSDLKWNFTHVLTFFIPAVVSDLEAMIPCSRWLEPISKLLEENESRSEVEKAEEIVGEIFPANEQATLPS